MALADWFEAVRAPDGYGGPVAHWWRDCLVDCRPGHDWRYEGIIAGYLALHRATGAEQWLDRARRAGDDLVAAQTPAGHFTRSRFELNPGEGGTPHEAAAATGLLRLAAAVRGRDPDAARPYLEAARANLDRGLIARLWDPLARSFRDDPDVPSLVPNKVCTAIEALVLLAEATGEARYVDEYARGAGEAVLRLQVRRARDRLDGAIAQNAIEGRVIAKYFPYYVARCVPGLLALARATGDEQFAEGALAAGRFVARSQEDDGGFPQVLYEDGRVNRFPRWVAAVGDVLRALELLRPFGLTWDAAASRDWLLSGMLPTGGVMTARGFASQATSRPPEGPPEFRDLLCVAGWADKAFRYLAEGAEGAAPPVAEAFEAECQFLGRRLVMRAEGASLELRERGRVVYRWRAGSDWAEVVEPWLAAR